MPKKTAAERVAYNLLKHKAAAIPTSPKQREEVVNAQLELLKQPGWNRETIFLKSKLGEPGEDGIERKEYYLSKSRPWHDFFTNKGHKQSVKARNYLLEIARSMVTDPNTYVPSAAERLANALADKQKPIAVGGKLEPGTAFHYGELDNVPVLRDALQSVVGAYTNSRTHDNAEKAVAANQTGGDVNATGAVKKETLASQQPDVEKPIAPTTPPVAPAKSPDMKVSLYGHYPDPVYCGPAPQKGQPRFSDTTSRDQAARSVYRYLSGKPPVPPGLLRVVPYDNGDSYFEVIPENAAIDPEDAKTGQHEFAQFFYDHCQAYVNDPKVGERIRYLAAGGMKIAENSLKDGTGLPNSPAMVEFFAQLAGVGPQRAPERKGVAAAQSPSQMVAMVDANDRRNVHTNPSTPAAILKSLLNQPGNENYVLRTTIDNSGAVHVEAVPPITAPVNGRQDTADKNTCVLLSNVARDYLNHPDPNVQAMAKRLQEVARRSNERNLAIRNSPGLQKILAALTQQPKTPVTKPVAQTAPAPKLVPAPTPWVIAGSYATQDPRKLEPRTNALIDLVNSLRQAPKNWLLEVGTDVSGNQVSVRARPPAPIQAPFDKAANEAAYQFFQDLAQHYIDRYRNGKKPSDKAPALLAVQLLRIANNAQREQIKTPITNQQELQDILLQLAAAG